MCQLLLRKGFLYPSGVTFFDSMGLPEVLLTYSFVIVSCQTSLVLLKT